MYKLNKNKSIFIFIQKNLWWYMRRYFITVKHNSVWSTCIAIILLLLSKIVENQMHSVT